MKKAPLGYQKSLQMIRTIGTSYLRRGPKNYFRGTLLVFLQSEGIESQSACLHFFPSDADGEFCWKLFPCLR
jgi:hypothetical protein